MRAATWPPRARRDFCAPQSSGVGRLWALPALLTASHDVARRGDPPLPLRRAGAARCGEPRVRARRHAPRGAPGERRHRAVADGGGPGALRSADRRHGRRARAAAGVGEPLGGPPGGPALLVRAAWPDHRVGPALAVGGALLRLGRRRGVVDGAAQRERSAGGRLRGRRLLHLRHAQRGDGAPPPHTAARRAPALRRVQRARFAPRVRVGRRLGARVAHGRMAGRLADGPREPGQEEAPPHLVGAVAVSTPATALHIARPRLHPRAPPPTTPSHVLRARS
eukprot:4777074-Prymnesium_polylepis.1